MVRRLFDAFRVEAGAPAVSLDDAHDPTIEDETLAALLADAVDPELSAFSLAF